MSVPAASSTTRGAANPLPVGEFWQWTHEQCFTDHLNRLQPTHSMLTFLGGWKEDTVLSLLLSSSLDCQKVPLGLPKVPFPHCITRTSGKMYSCFLTTQWHKAELAESPAPSPTLGGLIQSIWHFFLSLEDAGLPTVFSTSLELKLCPCTQQRRSRSSKSPALPAKSTKELLSLPSHSRLTCYKINSHQILLSSWMKMFQVVTRTKLK